MREQLILMNILITIELSCIFNVQHMLFFAKFFLLPSKARHVYGFILFQEKPFILLTKL